MNSLSHTSEYTMYKLGAALYLTFFSFLTTKLN